MAVRAKKNDVLSLEEAVKQGYEIRICSCGCEEKFYTKKNRVYATDRCKWIVWNRNNPRIRTTTISSNNDDGRIASTAFLAPSL